MSNNKKRVSVNHNCMYIGVKEQDQDKGAVPGIGAGTIAGTGAVAETGTGIVAGTGSGKSAVPGIGAGTGAGKGTVTVTGAGSRYIDCATGWTVRIPV
jgi:hypothetical protein